MTAIITPKITAADIHAVYAGVSERAAEAAAASTIREQRFAPRALRFVATYTLYGAASMGYGHDIYSARADLIRTLEFNLENNGRAVI